MVNNSGLVIHKLVHKKGRRHDYNIYKKNQPVTPKQVVNVFDLEYPGVEKDFPNKYHLYRIKRKDSIGSTTKRRKRIQQKPF